MIDRELLLRQLKHCADKPMRNLETFPMICRDAYEALSTPLPAPSGAVEALRAAREVVDACAGDNRPAVEWARQVRDQIDAALAQQAPEGWRMVPVEPTEDMVCAVDHDDCATPDSAERAYRAMLHAAPLAAIRAKAKEIGR